MEITIVYDDEHQIQLHDPIGLQYHDEDKISLQETIRLYEDIDDTQNTTTHLYGVMDLE